MREKEVLYKNIFRKEKNKKKIVIKEKESN